MKFTYNWLKSFIDLTVDVKKVTTTLSNIGLEVEYFQDKRDIYNQFCIVEIIEIIKHPNADKLTICQVNDGVQVLQVICGADNIQVGSKVVLAPVGSVIPSNQMVIKESYIRGIKSYGMLCSESEMLIGSSAGIIEVVDDHLELGMSFADQKTLFNDKIIAINITPNRGDCASVSGIARDLSATGVGTLKKKYRDFYKGLFNFNTSIDQLSIVVEDKHCYHIALCKIKNIDNTKALSDDIKCIFILLGIKQHTVLVDLSNFSMYEFGRPNHIYDADKIEGDIKVRLSREGEFFQSLEDRIYCLPKNILVVADAKKVLSIAGIIGGKSSKVDNDTKNILIEVASFNPQHISQSARELNLRTESSFRFERRVDYGSTALFMSYISNLIISHCGGEISGSVSVQNLETCYDQYVQINYQKLNQLLGLEIPEHDVHMILNDLGFINIRPNFFYIPTWRQGDVANNADIAEEIIRIKGTEKLLESGLTHPYKRDFETKELNFLDIFQNTLVYRGIYEVISWSFINECYTSSSGNNRIIKVSNPLSSEFAVMRNSLIPGLLKIVKNNIIKGIKNLSFFEIGKVYYKDQDNKIIENKMLSIIRTGTVDNHRNVFSKQRLFDFYDLKDDFYSILSDINISEDMILMRKSATECYHPGKSASFYFGEYLIGHVGELHPMFIKKFNIKQNVICAEIFYNDLPKRSSKKSKPLFLSELHSIKRDFAFYMDDAIESQEIIRSIKSLKIDILESINIFDVYKSNKDVAGIKSIAFNVILQPMTKTLVEEEIDDISIKIINVIKCQLGGELRDGESIK